MKAVREKQKVISRRHYENNREAIRDSWLRRTYGTTLEEARALLEAHGGACAICRKRLGDVVFNARGTAVDHDHATGKVRGVLCHQCNVGIGHFRENPDHI